MSTEYELITESKDQPSLELLEHSCKFDISMYEGCKEICNINNLSLDDLKELNQKITNIISYFDTDYEECKIIY